MVYFGSLVAFGVCYIVFGSSRLEQFLPEIRIGGIDFGGFWYSMLVWQLVMIAVLATERILELPLRLPWLRSLRVDRGMGTIDKSITISSLICLALVAWQGTLYDEVAFVILACALTGVISLARQGGQLET